MNTNIQGNFQFCISVPFSKLKLPRKIIWLIYLFDLQKCFKATLQVLETTYRNITKEKAVQLNKKNKIRGVKA